MPHKSCREAARCIMVSAQWKKKSFLGCSNHVIINSLKMFVTAHVHTYFCRARLRSCKAVQLGWKCPENIVP